MNDEQDARSSQPQPEESKTNFDTEFLSFLLMARTLLGQDDKTACQELLPVILESEIPQRLLAVEMLGSIESGTCRDKLLYKAVVDRHGPVRDLARKALMQHLAEDRVKLFPCHFFEHIDLFQAVAASNYEQAAKLVKNPVIKEKHDSHGETPLFHASTFAMVKLLIDGGIDPTMVNESQKTFLNHIIRWPDEEEIIAVVCFLRERGVNINEWLESGVYSLVRDAAFYNKTQALLFLLDNYSDADQMKDLSVPLQRAVDSNNYEAVRILVDAGVNVNESLEWYDNPLALAIENGNIAIAQILLDAGANCNETDSPYEEIISSALDTENYEMIKLLFSHGSDPTTMLNYASKNGNVELMKFCVQNGASINDDIVNFALDNKVLAVLDFMQDSTTHIQSLALECSCGSCSEKTFSQPKYSTLFTGYSDIIGWDHPPQVNKIYTVEVAHPFMEETGNLFATLYTSSGRGVKYWNSLLFVTCIFLDIAERQGRQRAEIKVKVLDVIKITDIPSMEEIEFPSNCVMSSWPLIEANEEQDWVYLYFGGGEGDYSDEFLLKKDGADFRLLMHESRDWHKSYVTISNEFVSSIEIAEYLEKKP